MHRTLRILSAGASLICSLVANAFAAETEVTGIVYQFASHGQTLPYATVCVLEAPNDACVTADGEGVYRVPLSVADEGVTPVTVEVRADGIRAMRSGTLALSAAALADEEVRILLATYHQQVVPAKLYRAYRGLVAIAAGTRISDRMCSVAGTVSVAEKFGYWTYDAQTDTYSADTAGFLADEVHGYAGAVVSLEHLGEDGVWRRFSGHGPVYTNQFVMPSRFLTQTSEDGGFFFWNLPAGSYRLLAADAAGGSGDSFNDPVTLTCGRQTFINVGPPQLHESPQ
ncbi:MAG: hypothetical protein HYV63_12175 [Candidatus Schekmanbacteria bacterium]|nr:hypothetical protein [Candidatus Schekmanbacteria bacterium]